MNNQVPVKTNEKSPMATVKDLEMECLRSDAEKNNTVLECSKKTETVKMGQLELGRLKSDPMENDLILSNIFRFCDVPSLKNCRMVSTKWRDLSLKVWRRKAVLQLGLGMGHNYLQLDEFQNMIKINPEVDNEDKDSLQLRKHPFKCYSLKFEQCMERGNEDEFSDQKRMAEAISPFTPNHVKILWDSPWFDRFRELQSILVVNSASVLSLEVHWRTLNEDIPREAPLLNCPNVNRLKLVTNGLFPYHSWKRSLWKYLVISCRRLEALAVEYLEMERNDAEYSSIVKERLGIVKSLKIIRQSRCEGEIPMLPLKELEIINFHSRQDSTSGVNSIREGEIIDTLMECNFSLERLSIHVGWHISYAEKILILPLLETYKDTLRFLRASMYISGSLWSAKVAKDEQRDRDGRLKSHLETCKDGNIIRMEVLREVELLNGLQWALFLLAHLELPRLKKLTVEYHEKRTHCNMLGLVWMSFPEGKVFPQLETFDILDNRHILQIGTIYRFAQIMPNLAHLTIPLDKEGFFIVCLHFKGLKTLNVLHAKEDYVEIDDDVLTGVWKAEIERGIIAANRPSLTSLEHLTDLSISCERALQREDLKITEHSVTYGFLNLPRLFNLSVAIKELSKEMRDQLRNHVKGTLHLQTKPRPVWNSYGP